MKEIWKDIKGYENLYQISNLGRVRNNKSKKILKICTNKYGYMVCCLHNKKQQIKKVHRLVAEAFIPNPQKLPQVNHKDENKTNNNVNNLEWCSNKYNCNYGTRGERIGKKLSMVLKKKIVQKQDNKIIKIWDSAKEAEEQTKIKRSDICRCCKGIRKKAGGYSWEYAKNNN